MATEPISNVESKPLTAIPQGLQTLDRIPPMPAEVLPKEVCIDATIACAEVGYHQIANIVKYEVDHPDEDTTKVPKTFDDMLDTSIGNFAQRLTKAWMKPRNPEGTIKLMKALQVDKFQKVAIELRKFLFRSAHVEERRQTNYTLGDNSTESLVDFATNMTGVNEFVHMGSLAGAAIFTAPSVASGQFEPLLAINLGILAINTYCVLSQRYTRSRLSIAIDKSLKRGKNFDIHKYEDLLHLKISQNERA